MTLDDDQFVQWRAVLEAIGYDYMEITDTYRGAGVDLNRITVTEGGSRDSLWNQIKADMLNATVVRYRNAGGAVVTNCVFASGQARPAGRLRHAHADAPSQGAQGLSLKPGRPCRASPLTNRPHRRKPMLRKTLATTLVIGALALPTAHAEETFIDSVKEAGRSIGHATRDITREIGHKTRDTTRAIGHGSRDAINAVGEGAKGAAKAVGEGATNAANTVGDWLNSKSDDKEK